jgi:cystathionine beta-lyase/cystathionine gamma-synthase
MLVHESDYLFDTEFTIATKTIHKKCDPTHGAVNVPIYMSSTFELKDVDAFGKGYFYTRCGNPTRTVVEEIVADIENNNHAIAFSSGMAAI